MEPKSTENTQIPEADSNTSRDLSALLPFFFVLVLLAILRVLLGYISVPLAFVKVGTVLSTVVFVGAPIFALYYAGKYRWNAKAALIFVALGLLIHLGIGYLLGQKVLHGQGFAAAVCLALGPECGFPMWCVGLGALLSSILKDRNLLIPVSIFLIGFDIFLVLTPLGPTKQILQHMPQVLQHVGYSLPQATATPTKGPVQVLGFIGPADFLFMGMFFVALWRFNLKAKTTVLWLVPAVLVYMLLIFVLPAIPMLVPIGLTVLIVNLGEFRMNKEEKQATWGVLVCTLVIIGASFYMWKVRKPEPLQTASGQGTQARPSLPGPRPAH